MELPNLTEAEQSGLEKIKLPVGIWSYRVYLGKCTLGEFFSKMIDMYETPHAHRTVSV